MTLNLIEDARTEYLTLCAESGTDATEFEAQCLSAVESWMSLDADETSEELHATIAAIKSGDKDAATAAYFSWLYSQCEDAQQ